MEYTVIDSFIVSPVGAHQWLIRVDEQFYIVSAVTTPGDGPETLVFPADRHGKITDFGEIVGLRGTLSHQEAINELLVVLAESDETEDDESNKISESDALVRFDDFLDECWENVWVCGYEFSPSRALKELDPTAYRAEFSNWLDSEGLELE
jgi:hypothetical protein